MQRREFFILVPAVLLVQTLSLTVASSAMKSKLGISLDRCPELATGLLPCRDVNTMTSTLSCTEESACCDALTFLEQSGCMCDGVIAASLGDAYTRCTNSLPSCPGQMRIGGQQTKDVRQPWTLAKLKINLYASTDYTDAENRSLARQGTQAIHQTSFVVSSAD